MNYTANLKSTGAVEVVATGTINHVLIRSATCAFQISFDGNTWMDATANDGFDQPSTRVYFRSTGGLAGVVQFTASKSDIKAQATAQSNAATYLFGNCGIASGGNANLPDSTGGNTNIACDANGYLAIPGNKNILISGANNGHRRQVITFSVAPGSAASLNVQDANQNAVITIAAGQQVQLTTDSDLYVSGAAAGTAQVTIGQIYLSN